MRPTGRPQTQAATGASRSAFTPAAPLARLKRSHAQYLVVTPAGRHTDVRRRPHRLRLLDRRTASPGGGGTSSLQQAVDAASPGDTVWVDPGDYPRTILVNKAITVRPLGTAGSVRLAAVESLAGHPGGDRFRRRARRLGGDAGPRRVLGDLCRLPIHRQTAGHPGSSGSRERASARLHLRRSLRGHRGGARFGLAPAGARRGLGGLLRPRPTRHPGLPARRHPHTRRALRGRKLRRGARDRLPLHRGRGADRPPGRPPLRGSRVGFRGSEDRLPGAGSAPRAGRLRDLRRDPERHRARP